MKIYHNPRCRKSREGVQYLTVKGVKFEIIEYLKDNRNAHNSVLRNDAHRLLDWIDRWIEEVNINE